ncbi:MAG TPA: glycosyltransferase [Clostridia bacterium]|nr:glycosyltransferase [Clostridia bacterium]
MSRILFVSSFYTGHGHKSITAALREQLSELAPDVAADEIDGFMLGGPVSVWLSKLYDKVATRAPAFWKVYYGLGNIFPSVSRIFMARSIKKGFCRVIEQKRPDLIVSVHPSFVGSVEDILEIKGWNIPVISYIADLDNVSRIWADKRSLYTLCPTGNARRTMLECGLQDSKIKVFGFPVRKRFDQNGPCRVTSYYERLKQKNKLQFLIMNGSQGRLRAVEMARILLERYNCRVVILAGNNENFRAEAEKSLETYKDRLEICGFVENVEKYMLESDILLLRASPNVMMEAVNLCRPFIVTGSLTGQEEKNPDFAKANNLGVICTDMRKLAGTVDELLADSCRKLDGIAASQLAFRQPDAARRTAELFLSILREKMEGI